MGDTFAVWYDYETWATGLTTVPSDNERGTASSGHLEKCSVPSTRTSLARRCGGRRTAAHPLSRMSPRHLKACRWILERAGDQPEMLRGIQYELCRWGLAAW